MKNPGLLRKLDISYNEDNRPIHESNDEFQVQIERRKVSFILNRRITNSIAGSKLTVLMLTRTEMTFKPK